MSRELRRREDWITLGRFVGNVPADVAAAGLDVLTEPDLLRVAFVLDDTSTADVLLSRVPGERYPRLVHAADEHDLWHALFLLLSRLGAETRRRVVRARPGSNGRYATGPPRRPTSSVYWTSCRRFARSCSADRVLVRGRQTRIREPRTRLPESQTR
ncbi:hypothetical protein ACFSVJ_09815 [Prauserella oleivorans]